MRTPSRFPWKLNTHRWKRQGNGPGYSQPARDAERAPTPGPGKIRTLDPDPLSGPAPVYPGNYRGKLPGTRRSAGTGAPAGATDGEGAGLAGLCEPPPPVRYMAVKRLPPTTKAM